MIQCICLLVVYISFSFSLGNLYRHLALTSGTVNTYLLPQVFLVSGSLATTLQMASIQSMQSIAFQAV